MGNLSKRIESLERKNKNPVQYEVLVTCDPENDLGYLEKLKQARERGSVVWPVEIVSPRESTQEVKLEKLKRSS